MIANILLTILDAFKWALVIRIVMDYIQIFARSWRPPTFVMAIFEVVYTVTEPPMAFVRRFIPPLRLGGIALDLAFIVLWIGIGFAKTAIIAIFGLL